jgi:hypothetical protein
MVVSYASAPTPCDAGALGLMGRSANDRSQAAADGAGEDRVALSQL